MRLTAPSAIAIYDYHKFTNQHNESNFAQAVESFQYCINYPQKKAEEKLAYLLWGDALYILKRYEEAIEKYKKVVTIDPMFANAYNNWGNALRNLKRPEEAVEQYKESVRINPYSAISYTNLGNALIELVPKA